jgi:hypothetical protein
MLKNNGTSRFAIKGANAQSGGRLSLRSGTRSGGGRIPPPDRRPGE